MTANIILYISLTRREKSKSSLKFEMTARLTCQISKYFGVYLLIFPSPSTQKSESEKNLVKKWKTSHKSFAINVEEGDGRWARDFRIYKLKTLVSVYTQGRRWTVGRIFLSILDWGLKEEYLFW